MKLRSPVKGHSGSISAQNNKLTNVKTEYLLSKMPNQYPLQETTCYEAFKTLQHQNIINDKYISHTGNYFTAFSQTDEDAF